MYESLVQINGNKLIVSRGRQTARSEQMIRRRRSKSTGTNKFNVLQVINFIESGDEDAIKLHVTQANVNRTDSS